MNTIERPDLPESYAMATGTSDLTVSPHRCDADKLLAAGYAAAGNAEGALALSLWRMRETRDTRGFAKLAEISANWIIGRSHRPGPRRLPRITRIHAQDLARIVLQWWLADTCLTCQGRKHPTVPGANRLNYDHDCVGCHGTGKHPVEKVVHNDHREHARWLAAEYDAMAGQIFRDMAKRLAPALGVSA